MKDGRGGKKYVNEERPSRAIREITQRPRGTRLVWHLYAAR